MSLRIYLTGRVAIEANGKVVADERSFRGKQGRLLFACLVSERTRPVSREELVKVLWPNVIPASWEVSLSALISRLVKALDSDSLKSSGGGICLSRGLHQYRVLLPGDIWIDTEAVTSAIDRAESAIRAGEPARVLGPATIAASIARRPFLPGIEGEWADAQRRRLERQLVRALDCLTEMWLVSDEPQLAVETAVEAIGMDPLREKTHILLMKAYLASGNRAGAIRAFHTLRQRLADELGTEPSSESEALYLRLLD